MHQCRVMYPMANYFKELSQLGRIELYRTQKLLKGFSSGAFWSHNTQLSFEYLEKESNDVLIACILVQYGAVLTRDAMNQTIEPDRYLLMIMRMKHRRSDEDVSFDIFSQSNG